MDQSNQTRRFFLFALFIWAIGLTSFGQQAYGYIGRATGTVLVLHFNEGNGQNVFDESSSTNDGFLGTTNAVQGTDPVWITPPGGCRFGNCLDFTAGDVVRIPSDATLNLTGDISVEAWVEPDANTNNRNRTIVSKWSSGAAARQQYRLRMIDTNAGTAGFFNNLEFCVTNGAGTSVCANTATNPGPLNTINQLYHVAGTYNATTRIAAVWVNGVRQAVSAAGPVGFTIGTSNTDLLVGSNYTDNANPPVTLDVANNSWSGNVDEVRITSTLQDTTITAGPVYNAGAVISTVTHTPAAGNDSWTIYNGNDVTINLEGYVYQECSSANTYTIPAAGTHDIAAGATITVTVGAGADTATNYFTCGAACAAGEMTTLTATDCLRGYGQATASAATIIDFVAWGADAGTGDDQAQTAGLWQAGTFISTLPTVNQRTVALFTTGIANETEIGDNEEGVIDWNRSPFTTVKGENSPRASGDWYSADAGAGGTRNIPYNYSIEVPTGSGALRVEIWDADVGNDGGAGEANGNRDRTTATFDTNTVYSLINPSGGTVATFTGDPTNGTDNTFMTPNGFRVATPTAGLWTFRVDATQQTGAGTDVNRFLPRAQGFQIATDYTQLGSNTPTTPMTFLLYPWIHSGCNVNVYDFDSDNVAGNTFTTAQQINLRNLYGDNAFNWTIPAASLSGNDVWIGNNNTVTVPTAFANDIQQTDYGPFGLVGIVSGYTNGAGNNGNYIPVELRNFNGGTGPADAGDADTDANVFPMYLPNDNGGPPNVPYAIQFLNVISGPTTPTNGMTTRIQVEIALVNHTGEDLKNVVMNSRVAASIAGNFTITYLGSPTVTQGTVPTQPGTGSTTGGAIVWTVGTLLGSGAGGSLTYQIDVAPIGGAARKVLTGTPALNGTNFTFDRDSHDAAAAVTETVGSICELAVSTGTSIAATAVEMTTFTATPYNDAVLLEWATGSELDNLGFNVYRSETPDGNYVQINGAPIIGLLSSAAGGAYYFVDQAVEAGKTYYYMVEDVDLDGTLTQHGPVSATINLALSDFASSSFDPSTYTNGGSWNGENGSGPFSGAPPTQAAAVEIDQQADDIYVELYPEAPVLTPVSEGGAPYEKVAVTGYSPFGSECQPALPLRTLLVSVPNRELTFSIETLDSATMGLPVGEKVYPVPHYDADISGVSLNAVFCESAAAYGAPAPALTSMAHWLDASWLGDKRFASIRVRPVLYSPVDGMLTYATHAVLRIHLGGELPPPTAVSNLTGDQAEQFVLAASPTSLKVRIAAAGLYRLDRAELQAAGFAVNTDPRNWHLYLQGREQLVTIIGEDDGIFDPSDAVIFYAQANDDEQAEALNTYWLESQATAGLRMALLDSAPAGGAVAETTFWDEKTIEQNAVYYPSIPNGEGKDHWFWQYAVAPAAPNFAFTLDDLAPEVGTDALLSIELQGVTTYAAADPDHHALVYVNGNLAGDFTWDGQTPYEDLVAVPLAWLSEGSNTIQVAMPGDLGGVAYDAIYVNRFLLTYPRHFAAASDRLEFSTELYGDHEVTDFASSDPVIIDWTAGVEEPSILTNVEVTADGGGFKATFHPQDYPFGGRYVAESLTTMPAPISLALNTPSTLQDPANRGDYVIITPAAFVSSLQPLIAHRTSKGHTVLVALTEDIDDEFGYGVQSPTAIREFLRYANANWALKPRYVLLVGDGTYDPKGYLGAIPGNVNFIPAPFVETTFMQAPSDAWYALMDDADLAPDLRLGRLPIATTTDLDRIVARVIAYETAPDTGTWERRVTFVADDVDAGSESTDEVFAQTIAGLEARVPANYTKTLVSEATAGSVPQAQQMILDDFNAGALITTYVGHGAFSLWASELLFQNTSISSLTNEAMLPLVVAMNCLNNYHVFPYLPSMSEALLTGATGGANALFSSEGLSTPEIQQQLSEALFDNLFGDFSHLKILGDEIVAAQATLQSDPQAADVLKTFSLMGDPALELKIPVTAPPTGGGSGGGSSGGGGGSGGLSSSADQAQGGCQAAPSTSALGFMLPWLAPLAYLAARRGRRCR